MSIVYILQNSGTGRYYIGCTEDLKRRLKEHNRGQTRSTKTKYNWELVYAEELSSLTEAIKRERQIKSYKGGNAFKRLIGEII